jgi:hypothetical protein
MNSRYRKSKIKNLKHAKQDAKQNRGWSQKYPTFLQEMRSILFPSILSNQVPNTRRNFFFCNSSYAQVSYATKKCHMCSCIRQVAKYNFFTSETTLFTFRLTLVFSIHHHITVCLTLSLKASLHYFLLVFTHVMPSTSLYNSYLHSLACWMDL